MFTKKLGDAWTLDTSRRWFARCDNCKRFRLWGEYSEVYEVNEHSSFGDGGWWFECERCLLRTITRWGEYQADREKNAELKWFKAVVELYHQAARHDPILCFGCT